MRIIFFGTPSFAAAILECLLDHKVDVVAIVTKPDKPQGRNLKLLPPAVKACAEIRCPHIPIYQPQKVSTQEYEEILAKHNADLFVVVAYGEIIKQNILDIPRLGCVNIHASLLPKYRGAAPIHRAIMNGEKETGVTIMEMVLALDAGDMLHVEKMVIDNEMNVEDVERGLRTLGCKGILKTIEDFSNNRVKKTPQDPLKVTYAHKITPEECQIKWDLASKIIHDHIRGTNPYPGAWCQIKIGTEIKRLKIKKSLDLPNRQGSPGDILEYQPASFVVAAQKGAIQFLEVQLEGKKATLASEFVKGYSKVEIIY